MNFSTLQIRVKYQEDTIVIKNVTSYHKDKSFLVIASRPSESAQKSTRTEIKLTEVKTLTSTPQ